MQLIPCERGSGEHRLLACSSRIFLGKLPTNAGWQPALPRLEIKRARDGGHGEVSLLSTPKLDPLQARVEGSPEPNQQQECSMQARKRLVTTR